MPLYSPHTPAALRRIAEERLKERPTNVTPQDEADLRRLQHELEVHQIELEIQNEELRATQAEVEAGLERYMEIYDFAPVGYLLLNREGVILDANLTGAHLLGVDHTGLLNQKLVRFVAPANRSILHAFLEKTFEEELKQNCEVALLQKEDVPFHVRIEAIVSKDGLECRAAVLDVSERHQAEAERDRLIAELQASLARVKQLSGLLPICLYCKKIRDDEGYWSAVESYVADHSDARFSHGVCPDCIPKMNADLGIEGPDEQTRG